MTVHRVWTFRFGRKYLAGRLLDYLSFYPSAFLALLKLLGKGDVAIAMTDPPLVAIPVSLAVRSRGAVLINWLQDLFPEVASALGLRFARGPLGRFLTRVRNLTLKAAVANVVLGQRMAEALRRHGVHDERIVVIPNWADGNAIRPLPAEANPLREEWALTGKFIAGYSGNLGRAHEFKTILGAAELLREDPGIIFLLVGGGYGYDGLQLEVERRGLRNFLFKPYQAREQLRLSLTLPDVHLVSLLPDLEGLIVPSKFYGIAAAGLPVIFIGSVDGELAHEIEHFKCGMTIQPADVKGLAAFLVALRDDPVLRSQMGGRIRTAFDSRYDKVHAVAKWKKLLRTRDSSVEPYIHNTKNE